MLHTPNYDAKIKSILNATKPGERVCALTGEKWLMTDEEIGWYKKFNVPPSRYSPLSRMKLVNAYFILFDFWYNRHAETGKPIISNIHPATGIRVLPDEEWFAQDFLLTGRNFDLSRPFFEQLYQLSRAVPRAAGYNVVPPKNSIAFISFGDQDSYFVLACKSKRSFYCINAYDIEDCAELSGVKPAQGCYNVIHSEGMYRCRFARGSFRCQNSDFIFDCWNCDYCFGATNKRNKKYIFFNEQLTKGEWESRVGEIDLTSYLTLQGYKRRFHELVFQAVWPESFNHLAKNSTGEYLGNVVNVKNGYFVWEACHDLEYCSYAFGGSYDCYVASGITSAFDNYYGLGYHQGSKNKFSISISAQCFETEYCESCYDCEYCFGCVGLRHKKFCILNKQYTEEEYWKMLDVLKCAMLERGEYGELPPAYFSTQEWNGSGAVLVYGATSEEGKRLQASIFNPSDEGAEGPPIDPSNLQSVETIPDRLTDDDREHLSGVPFWDSQMGRRFAYLKGEFELYKKLGVAPPRRHPTGRVQDLYCEMNVPIFFETTCAKCGKIITVAKNRAYPKRTIYCRPCYLRYLEEYG